MNVDEYLEAVAAETRSCRPERFLAELRGHLEDATQNGDARTAIGRLGSPEVVAAAWRTHVRRRRSQTRRRAAALTIAVATAASLAVAQHASGHRPPDRVRTGHGVAPRSLATKGCEPVHDTLQTRLGRSAHCRPAAGRR